MIELTKKTPLFSQLKRNYGNNVEFCGRASAENGVLSFEASGSAGGENISLSYSTFLLH